MASGVRNPSSVSKWCRTSSRSGCSALEGRERVVEDHRMRGPGWRRGAGPAAAVVASTCLVIDITGVMPLPPQKPSTGRSDSWGQKTPAGFVSSIASPAERLSRNQLETRPPATRLTVTVSVAVRRRGAGHGVRAQLLVAVDRAPGRCRTARAVAEGLRQLLGDVEDEGAGVVGLADDPGDPERVVAVLPQDRVRGRSRRSAEWPTGASATPPTWSRGTGRSRRARSGGRSRCACSPRRACRPARSACPR